MKKIITSVLAVMMLVSCFSFVFPASAQEDGLMFTFNYQDKNNGIVDNKKTAVLEKVTVDGVKALKVTPSPDTALANDLRLECWSLSYTPQQLQGAKYMTIQYKYEGSTTIDAPMTIQLHKSDGALRINPIINSTEKVKSGEWTYAVFDVSQINAQLDFTEGKKFSQFHLWPFGRDIRATELTPDQVVYIADVSFYNKAPAIEGVYIPGVSPEPVFEPVEATMGDENGVLAKFNYADVYNGIVNGSKTAAVTREELDGEKVLKVVPTPDTALVNQLALDCWSLKYTQADIGNIKFVTVKYKYDAPADAVLDNMTLKFTSTGKALKSGISADSLEPVVIGEWATAVFYFPDFKKSLNTSNPAGIMEQFHLYPLGNDANVKLMDDRHTVYISDVTFYSLNPDPNAAYTVVFKNTNPEIDGADPEPLVLKRGTKFVVPEQNYELRTGTFKGWKCSEDGKLYMPGEELVLPDNDVSFTAEFDIPLVLGEYKAINFTDYSDGSANKLDNIIVTNEIFQNKEVVKITPNPTSENAGKNAIIDGYSYASAEIDLDTYKYLVITYYMDGELPADTHIWARLISSGNILTKTFSVLSDEKLESGRWSFATFDFSGVDANLNPELTTHVLDHMQLYVFDGCKPVDFKDNQSLYINNLMFFKEPPELEIHESYMKGYTGGIFKPQGNMTRAEAATIVARLAAGSDELVPTDKTTAFADVAPTEWYHKYISYVESLGYLSSYSGQYLPNQAITRAEFVELVYNMGLLSDKGANGVFTDVAATHPKAQVIEAAGKAGLVNGYANGDGTFSFRPDATITRAEVVKVINNAYSRSITPDMLSSEVKYTFDDVALDFWAYADIMEATLAHVQGKNGWAFCMVSPYAIFGRTNDNLDYAGGEAYVAALDETSAKKIEEIRYTPNMDLSGFTGTKYYVSSNKGDDANDGLTPETAWKTIAKMEAAQASMNAGDVVLLERGSLWRERFSPKSGITYTAYGVGPKPVLYGSPENGADASKWSLMDGTTNIWVYANQLPDVGGIIIDGGKVLGLKEVPDFYNGAYYVRNSGRTKGFDIATELNENHEFFSFLPKATSKEGRLYFRCDEGNPGELYSQIEFNINGSVITNGVATDTHFDNLCIMYTGTHGIGSRTTKNLKVTNCEIGWIGGTVSSYSNGSAVRLGNGIEIYGGVDGFLVDNNYIYQCYDAGATHQYSEGGTTNISMYNITYSNNVIEDCIYSIEYFNGTGSTPMTVRDGKNILISNNILRRAGYGWGNQRPDSNTCAHIKSWGHSNQVAKGTFIIENNIFDRSSWNLVQTKAAYEIWCPIYRNNTYVQMIDAMLCEHADMGLMYNCYAQEAIKYELGDEGGVAYFLPQSYAHDGYLSRG